LLVRRSRASVYRRASHGEPARFFFATGAVLEWAGAKTVPTQGLACLESRAELVPTSIGGQVDDDPRRLETAAGVHGRHPIIASAASARSTDRPVSP
jgi:hypothetical protein